MIISKCRFHFSCKNKKYLAELPTVSVVFPFYNEHWSTLLRSVYSVLNRSPPELLAEIILVDDCSTKDFLKGPLDRYVKKFLPKVQVIHLPERSGLITARLAGKIFLFKNITLFLLTNFLRSQNCDCRRPNILRLSCRDQHKLVAAITGSYSREL